MCSRHPLRQIIEERRRLKAQSRIAVGGVYHFQIFGTCLLRYLNAMTQFWWQQRQRGRHQFGQSASTLAAPKDKKPDRATGCGRSVNAVAQSGRRRAYRISRENNSLSLSRRKTRERQ